MLRRFYFDVVSGDISTRDDEGLKLKDLDAAEAMAIQAAAEIGRDSLPKRRSPEICVQVRDEHSETVISVAVSMTVRRKAFAKA